MLITIVVINYLSKEKSLYGTKNALRIQNLNHVMKRLYQSGLLNNNHQYQFSSKYINIVTTFRADR